MVLAELDSTPSYLSSGVGERGSMLNGVAEVALRSTPQVDAAEAARESMSAKVDPVGSAIALLALSSSPGGQGETSTQS